MLILYTHYLTGHNGDRPQNTNFYTLFQKIHKEIIDYFKGLLTTHNLDIFMSRKNVGLNGLSRLVQIRLNESTVISKIHL